MLEQQKNRSVPFFNAQVTFCYTADFESTTHFYEELLGLPVRVGKPVDIGGLSDKVANPAQAVGLGLLRWGRRVDTQPRLRRLDSNSGQRFLKWLRALLPG